MSVSSRSRSAAAATWAAHSSGALNLSEQNLFTDAAFRVYFERLRPGGFLSFSLWDDNEHAIILRLLATAEAAVDIRFRIGSPGRPACCSAWRAMWLA